MRGWPVTLTEPDLLDAPVVLRPLRFSDARIRRQVREANASWLRPWVEGSNPGTPQAQSPIEPFVSMARRSPVGSYLSVLRRRREATQGVALLWVVRYGGQFAGELIVWHFAWGSARSAQVGYWIDQSLAGRGIAPTVLAMAVDHCFRAMGLHRIEASIRPENAASRRVVEKLGFRNEGTRVREVHIDGDWRDHICYAITAEEVPAGMLTRWRSSVAVSRPGA